MLHFILQLLASCCCCYCMHALSASDGIIGSTAANTLQDYTNTSCSPCPPCPPWWDHEDGTCTCKQFKSDQFFSSECVSNTTDVVVGKCLTWDVSIDKAVITDCPYFNTKVSNVCENMYYSIPPSIPSLNLSTYVCSPFFRQGKHCGECMDSYGPSPLLNGINIQCAKCHDHDYKWLLHVFLQLFMVTVLYFVFVLCECRGTSSPLNVLAYFYQVIINAVASNVILYAQVVCVMENTFVLLLLTTYALWNLDFFRYSLKPVCVSPKLSNVHVLLFDYVIAFYPILLTVLSCLLIWLHSLGIRFIVWLWRPFKWLFSRYKKEWDPMRSILSTFATFLLLSYSKILFTSVNLLYGVPVFDNDEKNVANSPVLYYDTSLEYFGPKHVPYACLAFIVILTFVLLPPTVLLLYPTKCFKKILERCRFRRWNSLSIIMDIFQGWYKDGTDGGRDYRALSALYMLLRFGFASEFVLVLMFQYSTRYNAFEWTLPSVIHVGIGCFYLVIKPYKKNWMNTVDGLVLVLLGLITSMIIISGDLTFGLALLLTMLPGVVALVYAAVRFFKNMSCFVTAFGKCAKCLRQCFCGRGREVVEEEFIDRRLMQSGQHDSPLRSSLLF